MANYTTGAQHRQKRYDAIWEAYDKQQAAQVESIITDAVINGGRTVRVHTRYVYVALAMAARGLIRLGSFDSATSTTEVSPA